MQKSCKLNPAINQFCSVIWNIANNDQGRVLKGVMATSVQILYSFLIVCVQIEVLCKQDVNMIVDVHEMKWWCV